MAPTSLYIAVAVFNLLVGAALVLRTYSYMEEHLIYGAVGGLVTIATLIHIQVSIGQRFLTPSVEELRTVAMIATFSAFVGVTLVLISVEPELN